MGHTGSTINHNLQSPPKIHSCTSFNFHLLIPSLLVTCHKIILTISTNTLFLYTSGIFHLLILGTTISIIYRTIPQSREIECFVRTDTVLISRLRRQSCEVWDCFNLLPYCSGSEYWCIAGGSFWWRCLTYCHYFHTLLIPSQELTFLWKSVA